MAKDAWDKFLDQLANLRKTDNNEALRQYEIYEKRLDAVKKAKYASELDKSDAIRKEALKMKREFNKTGSIKSGGAATVAGLSRVAGAAALALYPSKLGEGDDNVDGMKANDFSQYGEKADPMNEKDLYLQQRSDSPIGQF